MNDTNENEYNAVENPSVISPDMTPKEVDNDSTYVEQETVSEQPSPSVSVPNDNSTKVEQESQPYGQNIHSYTAPENGQTGTPYPPLNNSTRVEQPRPSYTPQYNPIPGQMYYAPNTPAKKTKEKKQSSNPIAAVIAICAVAILLCGVAGFGGAVIANKMTKTTPVSVGEVDSSPIVVYRDTTVKNSDGSDAEALTYAGVASLVKSSVVEINTEFTTRSAWFQYVDGGAGSGVIISEDGYLITNAHVIMNSDSSAVADTITVRLVDGTEYPATVKGYDSEADIALLKIDATGLDFAICGNSDSLVVGDEVVAVGNPLGELGGTVTNGIISATEREIEVSGTTMTLIQTNTAINPGNSGGGLFNMKGELVGIVNAKSSGSNIEGLGFAIPVNDALTVSEQLMEYGYVRGKVKIGVTFQDISSSTYYYYYNIKPGIYVSELEEGFNDGVLKVGDRVIAVNGTEVSSSDDIKAIISSSSVGDKIKFQLYRDNKLIEVEVTCYEKTPTTESKDVDFNSDDAGAFGIQGNNGSGFEDYGDMEDFFRGFFG